MEKSERYDRRWYMFLKDEIISDTEEWKLKDVDYAFMHGQVAFAQFAGLITKFEAEELVDMIPCY